MFAKLLKHEWKSNASLLGILSLAALGVGVLGGIVLGIQNCYSESLPDTAASASGVVLYSALSTLLSLLTLALFAYVAATSIILLVRFYKSRFTDEGYLTFTLPVKTSAIFWSSFVNMLVWQLISLLVVLGAVFTALVVAAIIDGRTVAEAISISEGWESLLDIYLDAGVEPAAIVLAVLDRILQLPVYLAVIMCCLTMGAVIAKKHKLLTAFGIYYIQSFLVNIITTISMTAALLPNVLDNQDSIIWPMYAVQLAVHLVLGVVSYFLSIYLMKNKLNLS